MSKPHRTTSLRVTVLYVVIIVTITICRKLAILPGFLSFLCLDLQALIDCYLPHIRPTQSCTEAFDKYFRNFISEKQYRNACRYVTCRHADKIIFPFFWTPLYIQYISGVARNLSWGALVRPKGRNSRPKADSGGRVLGEGVGGQRAPFTPDRGPGERCKLLQWGSESPTANAFWAH